MPRAIVLGGGIAGMTAAHELAERGFEVVVLERRDAAGGKARSIEVPPGRLGERAPGTIPGAPPEIFVPWVPGEHGFRFFPGFYKHVIDSMRRTPTGEGRLVRDALVNTTRVGITQYTQPMFELPARFPRTPSDAFTVLQNLLGAFSPATGLSPDDLAHFGARTWQFLTSSPERRLAEYELISWWDFIGAESRSEAYRKFLAVGFTRSLVAAQARMASARTVGGMFIQLLLTVLDPMSTAGTSDRVLDGPTSLVWIDPWRRWLESLGVDFRTSVEVKEIRCDRRRITGVVAERDGQQELIEGDYYVCAVPLERTVPLISREILAADPSLASLSTLKPNVEWMNGVQFYLRRDVPMVHGHVIHVDTEWALTSISQAQFWRPEMIDRYANLEFNGVISTDVSDWHAPGLSGRLAEECTPEEVAAEVWKQLKRSVNTKGADVLDDDNLCGWFLDPDIGPDPTRPGQLANLEPLLVNYVDTWRLRPEAVTAIPNLFLAADYVRTYTDLATMEAANEAGRRAVNGILDAEGYSGTYCGVWPLEEPAVLEPWRAYDAARFRLGLPWDPTLTNVAAAGLSNAGPALDGVPELMAQVEPVAPVVSELRAGVGRAEEAIGLPRVTEALGDAAETAWGRSSVLPTGFQVEPERGTGTGPPGFLDRLSWYRDQALDALTGAVPDKEPSRYLYDLVRDFVAQPSKGLRPALCLATCRAYGGSTEAALPSAAGLELLHNAFLVHDDLEDGSLSRRGQATMHRRVGIPLAVNTGDAMNALSMRLFRSNLVHLEPEVALRIVDEVDHLLVESLEGQAMELGWIRDNECEIGTDDYVRMVLKKTAWYSFIHPMRIGALIAGADDDLDRFNRFGFLLGAAFQIADDVLNLVGSPSQYGKEIAGDLCEGKRTLVLSHAFAHTPQSERSRLWDFFSRPRERRLQRELVEMYDLLGRTGSIEWAQLAASALTSAAQKEFPLAFAGANDGPDLDFVRALVNYLVERDV
ncbi:MAG TPA: FAD-dependent oxidoreductase [Pseudonocardiaceae bacterium]|nr:FAD-dependent oxidoreductase [Pseudonocardiaceae bacterium]